MIASFGYFLIRSFSSRAVDKKVCNRKDAAALRLTLFLCNHSLLALDPRDSLSTHDPSF